jgi:hypothetical protein
VTCRHHYTPTRELCCRRSGVLEEGSWSQRCLEFGPATLQVYNIDGMRLQHAMWGFVRTQVLVWLKLCTKLADTDVNKLTLFSIIKKRRDRNR